MHENFMEGQMKVPVHGKQLVLHSNIKAALFAFTVHMSE